MEVWNIYWDLLLTLLIRTGLFIPQCWKYWHPVVHSYTLRWNCPQPQGTASSKIMPALGGILWPMTDWGRTQSPSPMPQFEITLKCCDLSKAPCQAKWSSGAAAVQVSFTLYPILPSSLYYHCIPWEHSPKYLWPKCKPTFFLMRGRRWKISIIYIVGFSQNHVLFNYKLAFFFFLVCV